MSNLRISTFYVALSILNFFSIHDVQARDCRVSWRRAWRDLSCQEQNEFLDAILFTKESGLYDDFVLVHGFHFDATHGTPEFLPWHRWYVYEFEKMLQQATGKCIYVPYWDWERDSEWEDESDIFHPDTFGSWGSTTWMGGRECVSTGVANVRNSPFRWSFDSDGEADVCVERLFTTETSWSGEAQMLGLIANYDQYGNTGGGVNGFRLDFEDGAHMLVHAVVGGTMQTNYSPSDPLFWTHHANIDRLWTLWQDYWDHDLEDPEDMIPPWHYEGGDIDDRLPFETPGVSWDFRMSYEDGSRDFPTPRDLLSNDSPYMSVRYMNDHLASLLDYEANPRIIVPATDDVDVKCDRDGWRRKLNEGMDPEDVDESLLLPFRNSLRGDVEESNFLTEDAPRACQQKTHFTLQEDREEWERLCLELPFSTSVGERLALLAESTCNRRGNPRSDEPQLMQRMSMMKMTAPAAVYECFHRPDRE